MSIQFHSPIQLHKLRRHKKQFLSVVSLLLLLSIVIGCTQFRSSASTDSEVDQPVRTVQERPQPNQVASLPVPSQSDDERVFAPIIMDTPDSKDEVDSLSSLLALTVTVAADISLQQSITLSEESTVALANSSAPVAVEPTASSSTITAPVRSVLDVRAKELHDVQVTDSTRFTDSTPITNTSALTTTSNELSSNQVAISQVLSTTVLSTTELMQISGTVTVEETGLENNIWQINTTQSDIEAELSDQEENLEGENNSELEIDESIRVERTVRVPILMYHYLSVPPANADIYRLDLSVTPDQFSRHLDAMLDAGYTTISLFDLWDHLENGAELPPKPVVLTFDDGYLDNYENAFPLLIQRGMTATFFIVTGFIEEGRFGYVNWPMVEEMYDAGMSIESHSTHHFSLKNRDDEFLIFEALRTKEIIEAKLGVRPYFISYPAGEYDQNTIDVFHSAGYLMGVTTLPGSTHDNDNYFELRRVRIRGTTDEVELLELLELDW